MPQAVVYVAATYAASAAAASFIVIGAYAAAGAIYLTTFVIVSNFLSKQLSPKAQQLQQPSASGDGAERRQMVRQAITHWRTVYGQVRVSGPMTFYHSTDGNRYHNILVTLACHEVEEIGDIYFNDELVPLDGSGNATGKYAGYVTIKKGLGTTAGDAGLHTAMQANCPGVWTSTDKQTGHAKLYTRIDFNRDLFPTGLPNISAVVKGKKVYDPRSALTAYSANWALCVRDYMIDTEVGVGATSAEIDDTVSAAQANICDELVQLAAGSPVEYEYRYTCNGTVESDKKPSDIIPALLTAGAGKLCYIAGKWKLYAGAYRTPTVTLDEDDLDGPIIVTARLSRRDLFNGVKGVYVDPDQSWQPTDFPVVTNATYLAEDNAERIWKDMELPYTTSPATAQRIGKIELEAVRQQVTTKWPCKLTAFTVEACNLVYLKNTRMGWTGAGKVFEVAEFQFAIRGSSEAPKLGVDLTFRETASTVYDWSSGEETTVDPAPNTTLPDPFTVAAPTALALASGTSYLDTRLDGTIFSRIYASWTAPADAFVTSGGRIEVQYKKSSGSDWQDAASVPGSQTFTYILDVQDGVAYDVRVRSRNTLLVVSSWATVSSHTVVGKTAKPANVTGFSAGQNGNTVVFKCDPSTETDVFEAEIRYNPQGSTDWDSATPVGKILKGYFFTDGSLPPGSWTCLAKYKDTSENYSATAATFDIDVTSSNTVISETEEAPRWLGTLTNFVKHWTGVLVPDDQHVASYYGWEVFDEFVPTPYSDCYYEAPIRDVSFDQAVRAFADMTATLGPGETGTPDIGLDLDYRLAAGSFDGLEPWSIGSATARYFKFRLHLATAGGVSYVSAFKPKIDVEPREETGTVVAGASGTAVTFTQRFNSTPNIQLTPQGSGVVPYHTGGTGAGFTAHADNAAGGSPLEVGGTMDWRAKGT